MQLDKSTIDNILAPYTPSCRYLQHAETKYPIAEGTFLIPQSHYLQQQTGHFNAVDLIICYNQLGLVLFAQTNHQETLSTLQEEFINNLLIVRMNKVVFRKPIDPTKPFIGEIEILSKKQGTLSLCKTRYDFDQGKATGEVDIALIRR